MNRKNKSLCLLVAALLLCAYIPLTALATDFVPMASPVFVTKTAGLNTQMKAVMACTTSVICDKICVSGVTLQKQSGSSWAHVKSLPCPSTSATNASSFGASMDYSSHCTKGTTYRIIITYNADGVTASATSGASTYK
ncbi:MAG: hypothetical protein VB099_12705 [Candidatus Limiplasma sp.]|nr:hypothetical protein [Candidatus Limiplasma sp.]